MAFSLLRSQQEAERRLGRARSDRGQNRLPPLAVDLVRPLLMEQNKPEIRELHRRWIEVCREQGVAPPSRASLYNLMQRIDVHHYAIPKLPSHVRGALYNLDTEGTVPGRQLAFYCINYGDLPVISFAAGLPWIDLHQAATMRGFRPKSRGLLDAILAARGI